ncbi:hypothetical protein FB451DRAFT_1034230 [Mycena latifolia]|nr:hypothetical protein FB451DRAFT_1034230 [Mycena latifolia]
MAELAEQIVDAAALNIPPDGWTHTPRLRGEIKRLEDLVQAQSHKVRAPSLEKSMFNATATSPDDMEGEEDDGTGESFTPGTFVEIRRNEVITHAVVLGQEVVDSRMHVYTISSDGEIWNPLRDDIMFAVPGLAPPELAHRCSMLPIATEDTQLQARVKMLHLIRQIEHAVEAASTEIIRRNLNVYNMVKSKDPDAWATTTVAEVARLFSRKPSLVDMFATHKYLMQNHEHFVANHTYRVAHEFDVRPASHLAILRKVTHWSRMQDGPLTEFAQRAIPIIEANRRLQYESRDEVPSQQPAKHEWTPNDIIILQYLQHSLQPSRSTQRDPYMLGQSAVMRQLAPDTVVTDHHVHMAVVDLGVYAPWQDIYSLRRHLNLDNDDPETSPKAQAVNALVQRSLSAPPCSGPLGPEDFYPSDPLDRLRHDFGDMPIYVIDDANAKELDDGFSVEPVAGEPDSYWVHVHIADPASTIPPTHILAQQASKQSQTSYFAHRTWPLFPNSLMFSGRPGFSLSRRENRVMTFSSKINAAGELVDYLVRPGIARNFFIISYDEVDLAISGTIIPCSYPFSPPLAVPAVPKLSDQQIKDLRTMDMLRARITKRRVDSGIIDAGRESGAITGFATPRNIESPTLRPTEFRGFPEFTYSVSQVTDQLNGARGMVAEAMKLACRAVSRWCVERGVEVVHRTASPLQATPEALEKLLAMRDDNGIVDVAVMTELVQCMPLANYSLAPGAHWSMMVAEGEGYTRVTSPLRRYSDLITHYQIQRSLLGEKPYFDTAYLQEYMVWLAADDRLKRRSESLHRRSWALVALKRWMAAPRTDVPDPLADLHAILMKPPRHNTVSNDVESEVRIPALAIAATLAGTPRDFEWKVSSAVRVKVKEIHLGVRPRLVVVPA